MRTLPPDIIERARSLLRTQVRRVPTGWPSADEALGGGLDADAVHEWIGACGGMDLPPHGVLIALAWQAVRLTEPAVARGGGGVVAWIGRWAWPSVRALVAPSGDRTLLQRSIWVDAPDDLHARVWAFEQALRCDGVAMSVVDGTGIDRAASRRLQLAADRSSVEDSGGRRQRPPALACVVRRWRERDALGSASTRWIVTPAGPDPADDAPRWHVALHRHRGAAVRVASASVAPGGVHCVVRAPWGWMG